MKKIISIILVMVLTLSIISCGNQSKNQNKKQNTATATPTATAKATATAAVTPKASTAAAVTQSPTATGAPDASKHEMKDYRITDVIHSEALKNNMIEEKVDRNVFVYLPPSYFDSEKKYPVLFYLHGHGEAAQGYFNLSAPAFDTAAKKNNQEFIVVFVDGAAKDGGAFYVNSDVSGNWEDYVVNEVVGYVDKNYRTLANKDSRGIFGFSMGGFGALHLAMNHPDVFGAVYSMSPGLIADGDMEEAWKSWTGDDAFKISYGRAFAPNKKNEKLADIPTYDGSAKDKKIIKEWEKGFGFLKDKVKSYLKKETKLRAINIQYGTSDGYTWIPKGSEAFAKLLKDSKIDCQITNFPGGHQMKPNVTNTEIAPFFAKNLVVE